MLPAARLFVPKSGFLLFRNKSSTPLILLLYPPLQACIKPRNLVHAASKNVQWQEKN